MPGQVDVVFVVLPLADPRHPCLGVSLLKAQAARLGLSCRILYCNLDFAASIGLDLYRALERGPLPPVLVDWHASEALVGEWLFADLVFSGGLPTAEEYLSRFLETDPARSPYISGIAEAKRRTREFVERWAGEIAALRPRVAGFTTMFDQTNACLAVARALKQNKDAPLIVFGGSNCEGVMGHQMTRSFPWIDYVCTGEGDEVFPAFLKEIVDGNPRPAIPGMIPRGGDFSTPEPVTRLDDLPDPDFHDYFDQLASSPIAERIRPELLVETTRGCWWGAKQHCTFCGLNGRTLIYRSRSGERAFEEIRRLSQAYGVRRIGCVDNIVDPRYFQTLFPRLIENKLEISVFYATKANMRLDQIRTLAAAGVTTILPGLESLSNGLLRRLRKGCTAQQNIQTLRWCAEAGVSVVWTLLHGVPGDSAAEYESTAKLVPLLHHLRPPSYCIPVQLNRFSPYFDCPEAYGITGVRPAPAYSYVFPLAPEELSNLAYIFEFEHPGGNSRAAVAAVREWVELYHRPEPPRLEVYRTSAGLLIMDTRPAAVRELHILEGAAAEVYVLCDVAHHLSALLRLLPEHPEGEIRQALDQLLAAKLIAEIDGQYVALGVFCNRLESEAGRV